MKPTIRDDAVPVLKEVVRRIMDSPNGVIQVNGYTDSLNTQSYNLRLSRVRAEAVVRWLTTEGGIDARRFKIRAYGKSKPIPGGRQKNRRVEVVIPRS